MTDRTDAEKYRLAQAQRILDLFAEAHHGRCAASMQELTDWLAGEVRDGRIPAGPIDPYPKDH